MRGVKCSFRGVASTLMGSAIALALAGCATTRTPGIKVEYVDRPVITEVKCVKAKDIPQRPGSLASSGIPENVERALSIALAKVSEWTRYGNKADTVLKGCAAE